MKRTKRYALVFCIGMLLLCSCGKQQPVGESASATKGIEPSSARMKTLSTDVALGDTLSYAHFADVKLVAFAFEAMVKPSDPAQFYTSYTVQEAGNVYAHLTAELYNAYMDPMAVDEQMSLLVQDDGHKKEYTGFAVVEVENGSELAMAKEHSIPPLTSAVVHFLVEVPKDLPTNGVPYQLWFALSEGKYRIAADKTGNAKYALGDYAQGMIHDGGLLSDRHHYALGETATQDDTGDTYIVQSVTFENTVRPPNAKGDHINFALNEPGQTYAHVVVQYTNGGAAKKAEEIVPVSLFYEYYYTYVGKCVVEEPGGKNFTYPELVDVSTGQSVVLHYMLPVPDEVVGRPKSSVILLGINEGYPEVYDIE